VREGRGTNGALPHRGRLHPRRDPSAIVGAIANEAGLSGKLIGQIDIHEDFTIVDLPPMPPNIFRLLQDVRVAGQKLQISQTHGGAPVPRPGSRDPRPPSPRRRRAQANHRSEKETPRQTEETPGPGRVASKVGLSITFFIFESSAHVLTSNRA